MPSPAVQQGKLWHSAELASHEGLPTLWLTQADQFWGVGLVGYLIILCFPRAFPGLALKVLHSGKPFSFRQTRAIGHPTWERNHYLWSCFKGKYALSAKLLYKWASQPATSVYTPEYKHSTSCYFPNWPHSTPFSLDNCKRWFQNIPMIEKTSAVKTLRMSCNF